MITHIKWVVFLLIIITLGLFVNFIKFPETQNTANLKEMLQFKHCLYFKYEN